MSCRITGIVICQHFTLTGVTSTLSHSMGTLAALKIFCTAAEISGPMPSPGINVIFLTSEANVLEATGVLAGAELAYKQKY